MTALPRLYARFLPLFAKMDLHLRNTLEGLLMSFATLPLPASADERQNNGEFVGFDGIENRGRLSNLLESEWLLRELDPDDFVRRVAEGEVMFRHLDFRGTGSRETLCVMLDCGPWMLGSNRIVALAALFYLALRADRIGARLLWTVPGIAKGWSEDLTRENIRIFLGRVVQETLSFDAIDSALEDIAGGSKECWYVGAAQTRQLTQHPEVTGSILAQTPYGADEVTVQITSRGRHSTLSLTPPPDADTVAALRRPFAPERKVEAQIAADEGDLSAQPYHRDWLLDRFNHAVLIRHPSGVLWYPFRQGIYPIWLAIPEGKTLLGVQPQSGGQLCVLLGKGATETELITVDVSSNPAKVKNCDSGCFDVEIEPQPTNAMGNLHVALGEHCFLVCADGTKHMVKRDGIFAPSQTGDLTVFSDGIYLIELNKGALRVKNPRRGILARMPLPGDCQDLVRNPRRTMFSPDTKVITFTTDGAHYTTLMGLDVVRFSLEDMSLLHLHATNKALAWNADSNSLVQFQLINAKVSNPKSTAIDTPITGLPRYCPLTQTVFAMNTDDAGIPERFIPLDTKRGWQNAESFDILDAIVRAETLWL